MPITRILKTGIVSGVRTLSFDQGNTRPVSKAEVIVDQKQAADFQSSEPVQQSDYEQLHQDILTLGQSLAERKAEINELKATVQQLHKAKEQLEQERKSVWSLLQEDCQKKVEHDIKEQAELLQEQTDNEIIHATQILEVMSKEEWRGVEAAAAEIAFAALCRVAGKAWSQQEFAQALLQQAVRDIRGHNHVSLHMDQKDIDRLQPYQSDIARMMDCKHVEWVHDATVTRGGVIIRTERGEWDARLDSQIDQIRSALVGLSDD